MNKVQKVLSSTPGITHASDALVLSPSIIHINEKRRKGEMNSLERKYWKDVISEKLITSLSAHSILFLKLYKPYKNKVLRCSHTDFMCLI